MFAGLRAKQMTRSHWVSDAQTTHCAAQGCGKQFDVKVRRHHCRRCGLVFCEDHSMHRMRLNMSAEPDEEGEMSRVCEKCFMKDQAPPAPAPVLASSALQIHVAGQVTCRSRMESFAKKRAAFNVEKNRQLAPVLEVYRQVRQLASRNDRKQIVPWQKDASAVRCSGPCKRGFNAVVLRKHHCRLCGLVVCDDCSIKRKARVGDDGSAVRACNVCDELISRWERSQLENQVSLATTPPVGWSNAPTRLTGRNS